MFDAFVVVAADCFFAADVFEVFVGAVACLLRLMCLMMLLLFLFVS